MVPTLPDLRQLVPEWLGLFHANRCPNPFAHPLRMLTWGEHFLQDDQVFVVTARVEGELVGLAPLYRRRHSLGLGPQIERLSLFGRGAHHAFNELPQVLLARGSERQLLRAMVAHLVEHPDWDWLELTLTPEQGWFEREWLDAPDSQPGCFLVPGGASACVVRRLSPEHDFGLPLRRNVRQSISKSRNRLERDGHAWHAAIRSRTADVGASLEEVIRLHRARTVIPGRPRHADHLSRPDQQPFLAQLAERLAPGCYFDPCIRTEWSHPVSDWRLRPAPKSSARTGSGWSLLGIAS